MVRSFLLFLSRQKQLRKWMETSSTARRLATRFVAGETLEQALNVARGLNSEGISVTLDHLGESVTSMAEAAEARDVYLKTLDAIHAGGIDGNVSLKLTQFGLDLSESGCAANVERLVARAAEIGNFVRIDMESSDYTDRTLALVRDLFSRYPGATGPVIQAYLYRSKADIEDMCVRGIRVRLCKGAYLEPATVAFPKKADVDANYVEVLKALLERGTYPALATHDEKMIEAAKKYVTERKIPRERFEFQMLYGIRRDLQRKLIADGYRLRLYVPFGAAWYPYYMRRMAERPANVLFILRNLFRS
ncbi:MAG TPA: proline dehydrogenase family protein [Bryobacteraceae bacterium]|jgi:proline dehydrogenase|nr:proline dehydrogenase family protein [Bryobacteraceae bacterium]